MTLYIGKESRLVLLRINSSKIIDIIPKRSNIEKTFGILNLSVSLYGCKSLLTTLVLSYSCVVVEYLLTKRKIFLVITGRGVILRTRYSRSLKQAKK